VAESAVRAASSAPCSSDLRDGRGDRGGRSLHPDPSPHRRDHGS